MTMPTNAWKRLWDNAQDAHRAGRWDECISTLRILAKHAPQNRESAREHLQIAASIRNAYRNDPQPSVEYRDPGDLDKLPGHDEDPWKAIEDWRVDSEVAKWEAWINACETWPFVGDTENFAGRYEWAEGLMDRWVRKRS